ncbi:MAG: two-component system, OmpR family, response regulator CiaR [Bacteroidota bacterium]|nr:two-component system, OmpR family, response regulator CiaR [Bacteroidota bacterium]
MKILIVEDEPEILDSIAVYLNSEDFICEKAPDFETASEKMGTYEYDIIILDITLPDGNGLDLLDALKQKSPETGVLIVSARDSLDDRLKGLNLGADDYLTKPFHLSELNARIKALVRRKSFNGSRVISFNEIEIALDEKEVKVNSILLDMTRKEFELLIYFISNKNRVLSKEAIAEHLWGDFIDMADNFDFIYTHIKNLRKKIEAADGRNYIKTVYGLGYKFTES